MKKAIIIFVLAQLSFTGFLSAQEKYGKAINIGIGGAYSGYIGHVSPVVMLNYEIDVVKSFTLAPFVGFFTYRNNYYWNGPGPGRGPGPKHPNNPHYYNRYSYRQTVIPFGVKGTYYFDDLLNANDKWDFYAAASLGFAVRTTTWDDDYYRDEYYARGSSVYADLHIGTEYHVNSKVGLFADASLGMLLVGLAIHH